MPSSISFIVRHLGDAHTAEDEFIKNRRQTKSAKAALA